MIHVSSNRHSKINKARDEGFEERSQKKEEKEKTWQKVKNRVLQLDLPIMAGEKVRVCQVVLEGVDEEKNKGKGQGLEIIWYIDIIIEYAI